jgi:chromosome partitioning protein
LTATNTPHIQDKPDTPAAASEVSRPDSPADSPPVSHRDSPPGSSPAPPTDTPADPSAHSAAADTGSAVEHPSHPSDQPVVTPGIRPIRGARESASGSTSGDESGGETRGASGDVSGGAPGAVASIPNGVHKQHDPPRIIALMNQKGGVGKTTTAANLGAALARMGKRVLMIDLDPQAHLSLSLGIDPDRIEKSMYDLLADAGTTADQVVQPVGDDGRLSILPAEVNLAGIEAELADKVVTGAAQAVLKQKVAPLVPGLGSGVLGLADPPLTDPRPQTPDPLPPDYVLIDCPPSLGLLTVNALTLAGEVIVPMQAHFLALQGLGKLFETIAMMKQGINPALKVAGVVLCMHEGNTILANEVISDVNGFLTDARGTDAPWADAIVYHPPIRRNIKLAESPSFGQSIFDYAPDCHGAKDYAKLAESVAAQRVSVK